MEVGAKILIIDHNDSFTYNLVGLFEGAGELVSLVDVWSVGDLASKNLKLVWNYDCLVLSPGPGLPGDYPEVTQLLDFILNAPHQRNLPILGICLGLQTLITYFGGSLYNLTHIQHGRQVQLKLKLDLPIMGANQDTDPIIQMAVSVGAQAPARIPPALIDRGDASANIVSSIFAGLKPPIKVGLYHSWAMSIGVEQDNKQSVGNPLDGINNVYQESFLDKGLQGLPQGNSVPKVLEVIATAYLNEDASTDRIDVSSNGTNSSKEARDTAKELLLQEARTPVVMAIRHKYLPVLGLQFHPESYMTPDGLKMVCNWLLIIKG